MRTLLALSLTLSLGAAAPKPYDPDPKQWRMEVKTPLGGWISEPSQEVAFKLVDPRDPAPPKDEGQARNPYDEEYSDEPEPERTPEELKAQRLKREEEAKANAWRQRQVLLWLNGEAIPASARVGYTSSVSIHSQNGENRLEIFQPDSGLREIRTWWVSSAKQRLRIHAVRQDDEYWGGRLEVMEPGGELVTPGRRSPSGGTLTYSGEYRHDNPPPGTYTLRWGSGWRGGEPHRIVVEVVLDDGTDQERRWRFEKLQLPGAGPVTLGTFDVEP